MTGFDIIFFWVARMMMMGLHFMTDVPFADVYIHRLVRDASGAKMSKSKGNVVDPLSVIDEFGADALRFTLARNVAPGHDIRLGPQDVENNRNFATKLWNAARFAEMNGCASCGQVSIRSPLKKHSIAGSRTKRRRLWPRSPKRSRPIRFNDAAGAAYRFVWNIYCDWYLELAKPLLTGPDGAAKSETQAMVAWARDEILKLLHPFMPFITEELWAVTGKHDALLALSEWPTLTGLTDDKAEAEIGWVIDLVTAIRSVRAEMNITAAIPLVLAGAAAETKARAERWAEFIKRLARVSDISSAPTAPQGSVQLVVRGEVAALPLKGVIDIAAERARLAKEMQKADADIARVDAKAQQSQFHGACAGRGCRRGKGKARGGARPENQDRGGAGAVEGRDMIDPNNRPGGATLVLTAKSANKIQWFDAGTLAHLADLDMPASTHELIRSPDGGKVYASVYGGGIFGKNKDPDRRIAVIDLASKSLERTIDVGANIAPHSVMMDASGTLWSTAELGNAVLAIKPDYRAGRSHRHRRLAALDRSQPFDWKAVCVIQDQGSGRGGRHAHRAR